MLHTPLKLDTYEKETIAKISGKWKHEKMVYRCDE